MSTEKGILAAQKAAMFDLIQIIKKQPDKIYTVEEMVSPISQAWSSKTSGSYEKAPAESGLSPRGLSLRWNHMQAGNEFLRTSFASHVSLRETQSSVSLRLTAPFKRSLCPQGDGKNMDLKEDELSCPKRYPCASVLAAGR